MAHSKSAKKRIRQNDKRRLQNSSRKGAMRTQIKRFDRAIEIGDAETAEKELPKCMGLLDLAAKTGAIHQNQAGRKKSKLAKALAKVKAAK